VRLRSLLSRSVAFETVRVSTLYRVGGVWALALQPTNRPVTAASVARGAGVRGAT
jgi:hypothetical protein